MTVYLVGAGPGDPGLLTVRGAEVLAAADVVVHDRLAEPCLLDLAPPGAERIDVGKRPGAPVDQEAINALLVERGRAGQTVVRLKGGDPFVFGRGGEEALALGGAGIDFEVVPGVTSAVAAPAYAGVPVTQRGLSASFTVVTGHSRSVVEAGTNWEALAAAGGTIVVLMGVAHRAAIAERLIAGGMDPSTPVRAVRWGTRPEQESASSTLARLGELELSPPATIVIGAVAGVDAGWYEHLPLFGAKVIVTRARGQASALSARLRRLGARPVEVPTIRICPPSGGQEALDAAARALAGGSYRWVVFTSANAVDPFVSRLRDARGFSSALIAAIGPGTAEALGRWHLVPDLLPERYVAEGLLEVFPGAEVPGRVLLPRAAVARDALPRGLEELGWQVDVVEAYRTEVQPASPADSEAVSGADAVTFTASSTVKGFVEAGFRAPPVVACIGPVTAATARAAGLQVTVEADPHTIDGLVAALCSALAKVRLER